MGSYINRDIKQAIYSLYGIKFFFESLMKNNILPEQKAVKRNIQAAYNQSSKIVDHAMAQLDHDQAEGLWRFSRDIELVCLNKANPRGDKEYIMVEADEALFLISHNHDCLFCDKEGKAAKKCPLRKIALKWQLIPLGKDEDCPFRREY